MLEIARLALALEQAERASENGACVIDLVQLDGSTAGRITAQDGRICWAVAPLQSPTISDIFAEEYGIPREELEATFQAARSNSRPFGEELVARELADESRLFRCLERQMVTALGAMSQSWDGLQPRSGRESSEAGDLSYDPALTIAPMDLLRTCMVSSPTIAKEIGEPPALFVQPGSAPGAVCFLETGSPELPCVPIAWSDAAPRLGATLGFGRDTLAVVRPAALIAASIQPYGVLIHGEGIGVVCARETPHFCVFRVEGRAEYGELMAHVMAAHRRKSPSP